MDQCHNHGFVRQNIVVEQTVTRFSNNSIYSMPTEAFEVSIDALPEPYGV